MHLLDQRFFFFFWGVIIEFSEKGSQDLSNGTTVAYSLANYPSVFTPIVYGVDLFTI